MRILVACEYSGIVRDAFLVRGHDAISCDLLSSERPGPHIQTPVESVLMHDQKWDMVVAFPPCTYLCNSGVRWLHEKPNRWLYMEHAAAFFRMFLECDAPRVAVENPVMHGHAREIIGRGPDQTVQPWQFGNDFKKRTCFWLKGLPPLQPTSDLDGSTAVAEVHNASPGPDRWKKRSRTYEGIAEAMANQWGDCMYQSEIGHQPTPTEAP